MYKTFFLILFITLSISIIAFVYVNLYYSNLNGIINLTDNEDLRKYYRLKDVLSEPIYNLHLIILIIDSLYFIVFIFFNNKSFVEYFGLQIDTIATQTANDFNNFFTEFFFAILIKLNAIACLFFFIIKSHEEINRILKLKDEIKEKEDLFKDAEYNLIIVFWLDFAASIIFSIFYLLKFVKVLRIKKNITTKINKNALISSNHSKYFLK